MLMSYHRPTNAGTGIKNEDVGGRTNEVLCGLYVL
jgi:hypothetical protein